ncbi:transporter substrate-binding domain-containing protein [Alteromonas sp. BMJM2]|uniref:transporter substrate-binding domain-containing protein n=1 Tax=Alteromonas sp. BMJM2 TaxID=2954241 RepID=UPI0022B47FD8|nr:transporter substrate-binding domain-containing protein [Alteromonas sp. BMJM2]
MNRPTAFFIVNLMACAVTLSVLPYPATALFYESAQDVVNDDGVERINENSDDAPSDSLDKKDGAANTVVISKAFANNDFGKYQISVLSRALEVTSDFGELTVSLHPQPMSQSRQLRSVLEGSVDIMWSVTSKSRESKLTPIRLPLLRGYSGHRIIVVNKKEKAQFEGITSLKVLKEKKFVQGSDWPDLKILKANGFGVMSEDWSTWFSSMYLLVERNVVDGFPRNIIEIHNDIQYFDSSTLAIDENHLITYPNYEYFFVRSDKQQLANRIRLGLIRLIQSGELEEIFHSIDTHLLANELLNDTKRQVHQLENPLIPGPLDYADWVKTPQLAVKAMELEMGSPSVAIDVSN